MQSISESSLVLRDLVAQWRAEAAQYNPAGTVARKMRKLADKLESELNALSASDTQPLTGAKPSWYDEVMCFWAVGEGDNCPNVATHFERDDDEGKLRPTCDSCRGAAQQAQEGYRTEQLPDVDFVVNASVSDVVELITTLRKQVAQQAQLTDERIRSTDPEWGKDAIVKQRRIP